ncbi:MAG: FAD-dependent oxidoreductase, partial [Nitrosopumilaceae archaeon]|nr:FAD-dependent oxidoreductase [Nitrosopumilaceae archaeon]
MVKKRKILILGGGFAGVECARKLESYFQNDPEIELVMVSEDNFLLFTPMLPQVASGMIETRHIIMPIRTICEKTTFYEGRVKNVDPYGKIVTLWGTGEKRGISIHYDFLVVALGSETNFFGLSDVEKNAYTMKTLNDAVMLRNRIVDMLE